MIIRKTFTSKKIKQKK